MCNIVKSSLAACSAIKQRLSPFGLIESPDGAFRAGHFPNIAPFYDGGEVFRSLSEANIDELEAQLPYPVPEKTKAVIPAPVRGLLSVTNVLKLFGLAIGGAYWMMSPKVGGPYGLGTYIQETPAFMSKFHFCFGSINGAWSSQAKLCLSPEGQVLMVHRDVHLIGMVWESLSAFITSEVERQLDIHDDTGQVRPGCTHLPGDTDDWEEIAAAERTGRT